MLLLPLLSVVLSVGAAQAETVDVLEQKILTDKSRRLSTFHKTQAALRRSDFKGALEAAKGLENNVEFADFHHHLVAQAEAGRMHKFLVMGKLANAIMAGEQAQFHFMQVQGSNPYSTLARRATQLLGQAEVELGEAYLRSKKRAKAMQVFESGYQRLSQANKLVAVPKQSIVSYAILCEKQQSDMCTSWVSKLSPYVTKSDGARVIERLTQVKRPYIEKTTSTTYRVDLDIQAFQKGYAFYLEGKYDDAFATLNELIKSYPRTTIKLRTKFWMARAAQKSKHDAVAETLYREIIKELPFSYYALLSSWFGNIDLSRMMDAELPAATTETALLTPQDILHVRRAETLIASGAPELAVYELQDVKATASMPSEFLVYLAALNHLADNHLAAFQVLGELSSRNYQGFFSSYGQKLYFPTTHLPLIRSIVQDSSVDPLLVISIIKQESAFSEEAASGANAYGLMQIIPPTAREMDPKLELGDLFKAPSNIKLGSKYIRQLLSRYKGNIIPSLAAYNAGPGNADRWLREAPPQMPPEEFIEQISFRETREYVQNILRNFYWYHRRIRGDSFPSLPALTQFMAPASSATGMSKNGVARLPASRKRVRNVSTR